MNRRGFQSRPVRATAYSAATIAAIVFGLFVAAAALTALGLSIAAVVVNNERASDFRHDFNQLRTSVGFSVTKNTTQNITTSVVTIVGDWVTGGGVPLYDSTNGALNLTSGIFTASISGQYMVTGIVCFDGAAGGSRIAELNTDGVGAVEAKAITTDLGTAAIIDQCISLSQIMNLPAGVSVWLEAFQDSGTNLGVNSLSTFSVERFTHKLSP